MEHTGVLRWKVSRLEETLKISDAVLDWDWRFSENILYFFYGDIIKKNANIIVL